MAAESIGSLVPTKIPGYADSADIQAALRLYHYGSYTYDTSNTNTANLVNPSIAYTINNLQTQITNLPTPFQVSEFNSKGVILTASAPSTIFKLSVGSNGYILTADSTLTGGFGWAAPEVTGGNVLTFTNKTLLSPVINLSTTSSTTDSVISWDTTNKKIRVGDGTVSREFSSSTLTINPASISSNNYTLVISDKDKLVELNNSVASTITIPLDSSVNFPVGSQIHILQTSTGQFTITGASGVTVNGTPGLKLRSQWSAATLIKRSANLWVVSGDLSV